MLKASFRIRSNTCQALAVIYTIDDTASPDSFAAILVHLFEHFCKSSNSKNSSVLKKAFDLLDDIFCGPDLDFRQFFFARRVLRSHEHPNILCRL